MALPSDRPSRKLLESMRQDQKREGDALPRDYCTNLSHSIRVSVKVNDLREVKEVFDSLSEKERDQFRHRYGKMVDLLEVKPQEEALSVMLNYWDPTLRVFTFGNIDTTPTVEEYALMLNLNLSARGSVTIPLVGGLPENKVGELFRDYTAEVMKNLVTQGKTRGWEASYVLKNMKRLRDLGDKGGFFTLLALAIYGLVLFPSAYGIIDLGAADVLWAFLYRGANPVPSILADTFLSLNHGRRVGKGTLRCCTHLLYVWMCGHVFWKRDSSLRIKSDIVRQFTHSPIPYKTKEEWIQTFLAITTSSYNWSLPGMAYRDILMSCSNLDCVPLIGTRGCVAYTPALVLRQYRCRQYIPRTKALKGFEFEYTDPHSHSMREEIRLAWEHMKILSYKEVGPMGIGCTNEYAKWFTSRGKDLLIAPMVGPCRPTILRNEPEDYEEECHMRAEIKIEEISQKLDQEKRKREEECQEWANKLRRIEEEHLSIHDSLLRSSQAQVEALTIKVHSLTEAIDDHQSTIDVQTQRLANLEAEDQRLRAERQRLFEQEDELKAENERLKREKRSLNLVLGRTTLERNDLRTLNEKLILEAKTAMGKLAQTVRSIWEKATPLGIPNQEGTTLYKEVKSLLRKWNPTSL